jgi:hypothetical protein
MRPLRAFAFAWAGLFLIEAVIFSIIWTLVHFARKFW